MKRTQHITLGLLAGMALAFTSGCDQRIERRDCVDEQSRITSDQNCEMTEQRRNSGYGGHLPYRYIYGGNSGGYLGDQVFNGNPSPGMGSGSGGFFGSIARGGFGGIGHGGGSGGE